MNGVPKKQTIKPTTVLSFKCIYIVLLYVRLKYKKLAHLHEYMYILRWIFLDTVHI